MDILPILAALKRQKTAAALIAIEIALCCAIVCNALFLIAHRMEASRIDSGIAENELIRVATAGLGNAENPGLRMQEDLRALEALPGVRQAALVNQVPFFRSSWNTSVRMARDDQQSVADVGAYYGDERLLDTLGLRLVAGRNFTHDEIVTFEGLFAGEEGPRVAIITQTLARTLFGDADALGKEFYPSETPARVVGVVERLIRPNISEDPDFTGLSMILPIRMGGGYGFYLLRAAPQDRAAVIEAARTKLREISPNRIVLSATTIEELRSSYFEEDRVMAGLLVAVVVALLIVTALGIVGLASFWVQRRRRQIGIRRALGATRRQILYYFQTENFLIVTAGIVLGMLAAYAISGWLMQQYELPRLPWLYLPVGALTLWLLGQVAVLAPALRAASVPPATATRTV
ncbi:ABC transporter permease [Sinimarinibacterium flocculans]|uniref:Putative ABC transport system permease protein n=1 Tax=Sinimarinibacterium flocculans TaxID=985250 RepID=A0A318E2H0_9GAMM|nr:FtsX-like permease family protein [Sinimarinibacterium flocculans]PXV64922.1 putative ABC transport system permease protein [Sinimarinibacterium flocculans]